MKMLSVVLALFTGLLLCKPAAAADSNQFANCTLVPFAAVSANATTTVGLSSRSAGSVYWLFFDRDGRRLEGGSFAIQADRFSTFILNQELPATRDGENGFLLFCLDDDGDGRLIDDAPELAGNAFFFDPDNNDAVFVPTVPVFTPDLDSAALDDGFDALSASPIDGFSAGAVAGEEVYLQYFIDGVAGAGDGTVVYVFSTQTPGENLVAHALGPAGEQTLTLSLGAGRLNALDVETIAGIDTATLSGSGLLILSVPDGVNHLFAFSVARSQAFGAAQTVLANTGDR